MKTKLYCLPVMLASILLPIGLMLAMWHITTSFEKHILVSIP
ncbi:hypothetical protein [Dictyobacter kobayashii]|nr:hypothetical protein [Dictyobacter kobayashii]